MQVKTINDYYEIMYQKFPEVAQKDIRIILKYAWKQLYLLNSYGGDVLITDSDFWSYFGILTNDSLKHFERYARKLSQKIRILYKRKRIQWNGYYYFALTDSQYEFYKSQINKRGRHKKYFKFNDVFLYKIFDECSISEHGLKYIFKLQYPIDIGYRFYKKELITDSAELIVTRDPLKFKDILVSNNHYEIL